MKIIKSNRPAFSILSGDDVKNLENACRTVEPRVFISEIDYVKGTISVGMNYDGFSQDDFMTVNVAMESIAAAFHEVYNRVYDRCI